MEFHYLIVIISVLTSASCKALTIPDDTEKDIPKSLNRGKRYSHETDGVKLPTYSIYLIGFTMLFMLIVIIGLAVALYLALKNKPIFGFTPNNKQYITQESIGVTPLYNSNYDEHNKNNGSTLTVNNGIIEISEPRVSDPVTPIRLEDSRIIFAKTPLKSTAPVMSRVQMNALCKEVLSKVQKSDSASFRDLDELLKTKSDEKSENKCEIVKESAKEMKNEEKFEVKIESQQPKQNTKPESKTQNEIETEIKTEIKHEIETKIKNESSNKTSNETKSELKPDVTIDVQIEVNNVESDKNEEDSDSETEYDTVPTPIRYRHSGPEVEDYGVNDIPLYDLPPRRSQDGHPRNLIQMDQDSQYLMPISMEKTDSCYINAKRNSYHSS